MIPIVKGKGFGMLKQFGHTVWSLIEKIVYGVLLFFCRLTGKKLKEEVYDAFMQFVRFGIVGVSNTIISYVIYAGCLLLFRKFQIFRGIDYLIAQVIQFILSVLWSFYWNNKVVFTLKTGEKRSVWKALIKTYVSYSFTGLFLNSILLVFWVRILHISEFAAPILNLLISVPLNFVINKFWAFRKN